MAKLEDIPKKNFFTVPEDYFDTLPSKIQSRIGETKTTKERIFGFGHVLRYALPVLAVVAAIIYYNSTDTDVEAILASVDTAELIEYLQESGATTDEVLDNVDFTTEELEAIENEVYDISFPDMESQLMN